MKVLFYGSNPDDQKTLRLEHDITELQRISLQSTGRQINFIFLPALGFEDLEEQLAIHRPDVVHISAHADNGALRLTAAGKYEVDLTAEALRALLSSNPPQLVYINACNSLELAEKLTGTVPFAIGSTAAITNIAARKSAVSFYRSLVRGATIEEAHRSSRAVVETLSKGQVSTKLVPRPLFDRCRPDSGGIW
jgi:hypothetical protein